MFASTILSLQTTTNSYASQVNSQYKNNASNCVALSQRYADTLASVPQHDQAYIANIKKNSIQEFKRLNRNIKKWSDLTLAQSVLVSLAELYIDTTMQRELNLYWVYKILAKFKSTKVVPIQVYRDPSTNKLCAWDGQHTAILLYIICVDILGEDPEKVKVPVNIYASSLKPEMRECFLDLNTSEGKAMLDDIDLHIQRVFGVRIDGSNNPLWVTTEKKQTILEKYDLFVTNDKFHDTHMPGAISRTQEINKLDLDSLEWLCEYLSIVARNRRIYEKEIMMMAHFFLRCRCDGVNVDSSYVNEVAFANINAFNADFTPYGAFWSQVKIAYENWHQSQPGKININPQVEKETVHGFPFLLAQLAKSIPGIKLPRNTSKSQFWPDQTDLF